METVFDKLKSFSFSGIKFPYQKFTVRGGLRDHVHEYPHTAGGAPEKLGRKLYEIQVSANFQAALSSPKWKQLWPIDIGALRSLFEDGVTADLHIPTIGTIKAYAREWEEGATATNRSGVSADMTFVEDQESAFLVEQILTVNSASFASKLADFEIKIENTIPAKPSIFDAITDAANFVLSFKDQFDLYGSLIESKVLGLTSLLREADRQLVELNDPTNYAVLDAFQALWEANQKLHQDILERGAQLREFVTPVMMPLQQVANAIYGASGRAAELLQLNALEDPLAIPAGTKLRYYAAAA